MLPLLKSPYKEVPKKQFIIILLDFDPWITVS